MGGVLVVVRDEPLLEEDVLLMVAVEDGASCLGGKVVERV